MDEDKAIAEFLRQIMEKQADRMSSMAGTDRQVGLQEGTEDAPTPGSSLQQTATNTNPGIRRVPRKKAEDSLYHPGSRIKRKLKDYELVPVRESPRKLPRKNYQETDD